MTTYWLLGEKQYSTESQSYDQNKENENSIINNPSITFQGPDSPAAHSLTHSQSPERNGLKETKNENKPKEIMNERDRIKHEIATFVAKDLINNIDNAVREFRLSQGISIATNQKPLCNGNDRGLITPTYDKELIINKGKVRDVVNRFNSTITETTDAKIVKK